MNLHDKLRNILHKWDKDEYYVYDEPNLPYADILKLLGRTLTRQWIDVKLSEEQISDIQNSIESLETSMLPHESYTILKKVRDKILELGYNPGTADMILVEPLRHKTKLLGRLKLQNTAF